MRIMRNLCLISVCLLGFFSGLQAVPVHPDFQAANEAYRQKDYAQAVLLYTRLAEAGYRDADLYYNLGYACYRQNDLGQALLWYERALRLCPHDADIRANIAFVNAQTVDQMEALPELFFKRWFRWLRDLGSVTAWSIVSLLCSLLLFASVTLLLLSGDVKRRIRCLIAATCFTLCLGVSMGLAFSQKHAQERTDEAIVTAYSVTVKSMPDASGTDLFTVHEGMKVRLTVAVGAWVEVLFPNGSKGWVEKRQLSVI